MRSDFTSAIRRGGCLFSANDSWCDNAWAWPGPRGNLRDAACRLHTGHIVHGIYEAYAPIGVRRSHRGNKARTQPQCVSARCSPKRAKEIPKGSRGHPRLVDRLHTLQAYRAKFCLLLVSFECSKCLQRTQDIGPSFWIFSLETELNASLE